jgi:uncharacterized delta-60 repeat protein
MAMVRSLRALKRSQAWGIALAVGFGVASAVLLAAPGDIDPSFGGSGVVTTQFSGFDGASAVAVQADGKIVAAGFANDSNFNFTFAVVRYNPDGTLDPSFGTGGTVTLDSLNSLRVDLAIDTNGNILVASTTSSDPAGYTDFALARLTPAGVLDATFGVGGRVATDFADHSDEGNAVVIQPDGKIVVAGTARIGPRSESILIADFAVARYNADGSLDPSFGVGGKTTTDFAGLDDLGWGVALQSDGRIVVVGTALPAVGAWDFGVVRYNADGTLDASFGTGGMLTTDLAGHQDEASAVVALADGRILVVGGGVLPNQFGHFFDFAAVRYEANGALDPTFGVGGKALTDFTAGSDFANDVVLQADGKIVLGGWVADVSDIEAAVDFGVARLDASGAIDPTFGPNGRVITNLGAIDYGQGLALQSDCKILLAGYSWQLETGDASFKTVRYDGDTCPTTPPPTTGACPRTQGYWQTHPEAWPVDSLTLGSQTYTKAELLGILSTSAKGDVSVTMAQQLIAAMLNVANGVDGSAVSATIAHAQTLLSTFAGKLPYSVKASTAVGQMMVTDGAALDQFNKGLLGPCAGGTAH